MHEYTDILTAETIHSALTTRQLGHPCLFFPSVGSTNDVALERAEAGAAEGLLVVAEEQTAGRGRLGRRWWAPPRTSLLISLLLRPAIAPVRSGQLTMCLGLAAVEGIEEATGLRPSLKWPNDLLLHGRKLAGMLTELRMAGDTLEYAVLGLGLNVNGSFEQVDGMKGEASRDAPAGLVHDAISLGMVLGRPVSRLPLLAGILARCEAWYDRLQAGQALHEAWAARLDTIGRKVEIIASDGTVLGMATGVTPEGALMVEDETGRMHIVWSGVVTTLNGCLGFPQHRAIMSTLRCV